MSSEPVAPGGESEPDFELTEASGVSAGAVPVPPPEPAVAPERSAIPPEKAVELLSKISLFSALQPSYLRRIANLGIEEDYPSGAVIFKEGAQGDKMYLILSGAVRIGRQVPGMGEEALAILRAGTHFGEMALIDDFPRSADARAHEACRLFVVRKEDMEDLLFVDRDLAYDSPPAVRPHALFAPPRDQRQDDLHGRHLEVLTASRPRRAVPRQLSTSVGGGFVRFMTGGSYMSWRSKPESGGGATRDAIENVLGRSCTVRGDLSAEGAFRIDGTVEGAVESRAAVVVGESGVVRGIVRGTDVVVAGTVVGDVILLGAPRDPGQGANRGGHQRQEHAHRDRRRVPRGRAAWAARPAASLTRPTSAARSPQSPSRHAAPVADKRSRRRPRSGASARSRPSRVTPGLRIMIAGDPNRPIRTISLPRRLPLVVSLVVGTLALATIVLACGSWKLNGALSSVQRRMFAMVRAADSAALASGDAVPGLSAGMLPAAAGPAGGVRLPSGEIGRFVIQSANTGEELEVKVNLATGEVEAEGYRRLRHLMRCLRTTAETPTDPRLISLLYRIAQRTGQKIILGPASAPRCSRWRRSAITRAGWRPTSAFPA